MDIKFLLRFLMPVVKSQIKFVKINSLSLDIDFVFENDAIVKFTDKELREILNEIAPSD